MNGRETNDRKCPIEIWRDLEVYQTWCQDMKTLESLANGACYNLQTTSGKVVFKVGLHEFHIFSEKKILLYLKN